MAPEVSTSPTPTISAVLLVREKQLPALLGLSRATCRRLMARGAFPACIRIGGCVAWRRCDLERWVSEGCGAVEGSRA
jgi:predicted DNA-binding transcriptional regulator AlpA